MSQKNGGILIYRQKIVCIQIVSISNLVWYTGRNEDEIMSFGTVRKSTPV